MKRKYKLGLVAFVAALIAAAASPSPELVSRGERVSLRDGKIVIGALPSQRDATVKPRALDQPTSARAEAWVLAHPPSESLRETLLDLAALADEIAVPLPTAAPEDDAAATRAAKAREDRAAMQTKFRAQLRSALRAMSADDRAALRASHVHLIQIARHVATRG